MIYDIKKLNALEAQTYKDVIIYHHAVIEYCK